MALVQKIKGEGRYSSAPAKFTVIGKFLVEGEGTEGREEEQVGRKGRGGGARPQLQGFK